jgi:hypothetical protein
MPEAHVNGNVEDRLKSQLIELFGMSYCQILWMARQLKRRLS